MADSRTEGVLRDVSIRGGHDLDLTTMQQSSDDDAATLIERLASARPDGSDRSTLQAEDDRAHDGRADQDRADQGRADQDRAGGGEVVPLVRLQDVPSAAAGPGATSARHAHEVAAEPVEIQVLRSPAWYLRVVKPVFDRSVALVLLVLLRFVERRLPGPEDSDAQPR